MQQIDTRIDSIGATIRMRRASNGLSQKELADKMRVSQSLVSQWEGGRQKPSRDQIEKLDGILGGVSTDDAAITDDGLSPVGAWFSRSIARSTFAKSSLSPSAMA